jgi:anti-anti-sigma factor
MTAGDEMQVESIGGVAVASLSGELDIVRCAALRDVLTQAPGPHAVALLVDLAGLTYLDSAGVHLLLDVHRGLARRGHAMHLVRPQRRTPALVLELTDLGSAIEIHADRASALAAMDPPAI